jgi:hypothetical protein
LITTEISPIPLLWVVCLASAPAALGAALVATPLRPDLTVQLAIAAIYAAWAALFWSVLHFGWLPDRHLWLLIVPAVTLLAMPQALTWPVQIVWTVLIVWLFFAQPPLPLPIVLAMLVHGLYAACLGCYGDAVRLRPAGAHLPDLLLWLWIGQALGVVVGRWLPPLQFTTTVEVPLLVGAALVGRGALALVHWRLWIRSSED